MGDYLPDIEMYHSTFKEYKDFHQCVIDYYSSMIRFWSRALKFYKRPRIWTFVRSAWANFDTEFGTFEADLKRQQERVKDLAEAMHMWEAKEDEQSQYRKQKSIIPITYEVCRKSSQLEIHQRV